MSQGQSPKRILGLGYVTASHRSIGSTDRWSTSVKYLRYSHDWPNDQHHTIWKRLGSTAVWRCPRPGLDQRRTVEPRTLAHRPMNVRDLDPDAGHPGPPPIRRRCSCKALVIAGEKLVSTQFVPSRETRVYCAASGQREDRSALSVWRGDCHFTDRTGGI